MYWKLNKKINDNEMSTIIIKVNNQLYYLITLKLIV